jgi:hypothetical protein
MNALLVLFAGNLSGEAMESLVGGKNSLNLAMERSSLFPGIGKIVLLAGPEGFTDPRSPSPAGLAKASPPSSHTAAFNGALAMSHLVKGHGLTPCEYLGTHIDNRPSWTVK